MMGKFVIGTASRSSHTWERLSTRRVRAAAFVAVAPLVVIAVTGCGGREAHPVSVTRAEDQTLNCVSLVREFEANERQVVATLKERNDGRAKNVVLTATGVLLFLPALFFIDPKSPERVEIQALRNRNEVLADIARGKSCSLPNSQLKEIYRQMDSLPSTSARPSHR